MGTLIAFEIKKIFHKKKNFIIVGIFIFLIAVYAGANAGTEQEHGKFDLQNCASQIQFYRQQLSLSGLDDEARQDINSEIQLYGQRQMALIRGDWKTALRLQVSIDSLTIKQAKEPHTLTSDDGAAGRELKRDSYLLKYNLPPIHETVSVSPFNFLRLLGQDIAPLLLIIVLVMLDCDVVAGDFEDGSYKLLLTQPYSRLKIFLSKFLACMLADTLIISGVFAGFFIVLSVVRGMGSPQYPADFSGTVFSWFFDVRGDAGTSLVPVWRLLLLALPLEILLTAFIAAFSQLISVISGGSATAASVCIIIAAAAYIMVLQMHMLNGAAQFIPFTYGKISALLDGTLPKDLGNPYVTYTDGYIVLGAFTAVCFAVAAVLFKRREAL